MECALVVALAYNPFHVSLETRQMAEELIRNNPNCRRAYEEALANRQQMGYDPTHMRI